MSTKIVVNVFDKYIFKINSMLCFYKTPLLPIFSLKRFGLKAFFVKLTNMHLKF